MLTAAPRVQPVAGGRVVVGMADLGIAGAGGTVITHALGSCIAVFVHDPVRRLGGCLHYMLPAAPDAAAAAKRPTMFANSGIPRLFKAMYEHGSTKSALMVHLVGGANLHRSAAQFAIGTRNLGAATQILAANGVRVASTCTGGHASRTAWLVVDTGRVVVRTGGEERSL